MSRNGPGVLMSAEVQIAADSLSRKFMQAV
jgi:hypothetical protein